MEVVAYYNSVFCSKFSFYKAVDYEGMSLSLGKRQFGRKFFNRKTDGLQKYFPVFEKDPRVHFYLRREGEVQVACHIS